MYDAVILSDLHLGSSVCQARRLGEFLQRLESGELLTQRLLLNGDVFDSIDFRRLAKSHWMVLSHLRKLAESIEVIWIAGNHDGSAEIISHLLGVSVRDEIILESGTKRFLVLHGHVFDSFIQSYPLLTALADRVYRFLQWLDRTHHFAKMAKRGSKTFLRNTRKIAEGAIDLARKRGCTAAICGHTHHAVLQNEGTVAYYNSGCWTELPCTYLTLRDGEVLLHEFTPATQPELVLTDTR
ncbi:MAG: UDP-2,3-diacylglucosamine diphosphatase [Gemmataceae bacterium]